MSQPSKKDLSSAYAAFLKSAAGQDLIQHAQILEKSFLLQAIKAETSEGKAHGVSKLEGVVTLRDYIVRMSKG